MIIDFHTHIFPDAIAGKTIPFLEKMGGVKSVSDGTKDGLLKCLEGEITVDKAIALPVVTAPKQFDSIMKFAYEVNQQESKIQSFGGIHPDSPHYIDDLKLIQSYGMKGIKLHPDYQGVYFNDIRYKRIVSKAAELGLTVVVHAGVDIGYPDDVHATPKMCLEVLKETECDKMVLAHLGGYALWDEVEEMLVGQQVYLDTAFIDHLISPEQFKRIVKNHGADKILFATDNPWATETQAYHFVKENIKNEEDLEKVLYKNALTLL